MIPGMDVRLLVVLQTSLKRDFELLPFKGNIGMGC